ncbi:MAG: hypothetical protein A3H95_15950 [Acidobacteria bacterium RIFCSPLOWO2_02_FULL_64_15]|nr:MAG: hypothetical protein A3H95_15950 [Acidobacteria bacterium RIFCSPLOWO2_02_FULL_64_15]
MWSISASVSSEHAGLRVVVHRTNAGADGAIIDAVYRVPERLSYLQQIVDARPRPGAFLLTGSQHFGPINAATQTLAGRTALLQLLPLSLDEIRRFPQPADRPGDVLWAGGYPRIYDEHLPAHEWLGNCAPDAPANC